MRSRLIVIILAMLVLTSCNYIEKDKFSLADKNGMIAEFDKNVDMDEFNIHFEKVCNDVTGYVIFYRDLEIESNCHVKMEISDENDNVLSSFVIHKNSKNGYSQVSPVNADIKGLTLSMRVYKKNFLQEPIYDSEGLIQSGAYQEELLEEENVELPLVFSQAFKESAVVEGNFTINIDNSEVTITKIAFGKLGTSVTYTTQPENINIESIVCNDIIFDKVMQFASTSGKGWSGHASIDVIENPVYIDFNFESGSGDIETLRIDIKK